MARALPQRSSGTETALAPAILLASVRWIKRAVRSLALGAAPMLTPMPISIRSRLLLLVLSVLLPAAAVAGWLISQAYTAEREALERSLRDTTHTLSSLVDRELVQRGAIARVLAVSTTLEQPGPLTIDKLAAFEQQARRALHGLNGWVELA